MEILLEKNRSVSSKNKENNINVELFSKEKLLPNESLVDNFSYFEQYNKERDECENFRLIFNVNPVCSNVLFNIRTEVVINEGSDECECLNFKSNNGWSKDIYAKNAVNSTDPIRIWDSIRNTEYSNKNNGKFVYHCGVDIFDNHMLRKNIFVHINKTNYTDNNRLKVYNTICDYLRDYNGNIIKEEMSINYELSKIVDRHIYDTDSLYSLKNAYYNRCVEKNGWWGFTNPGTINIDTTTSSTINTNNMLSNNKPCEFIDFYPDRTLFSFTPKFNKYRKRIEKNWDYCITYPYAKDFELLNTICGSENGAIRTKFKVVTNSQGVRLLQCTSFFKHNLKPGDLINIYYYLPAGGIVPEYEYGENLIEMLPYESDESTEPEEPETPQGEPIDYNTTYQKLNGSISVYSIGDLNGENDDRIFSIKFDTIKSIFADLAAFGLFFKKVSNGSECSYYFRKFKKIKRLDGSELRSDLNKAGFAENIYGDSISQVVFTDDLNVHGLKDENGRDISEVYFTVIKRNKGSELWYKTLESEHVANTEEIEFSHCFGKITTGIDFSGVDTNEEPFDYNVRYLHNLDKDKCDTKEKGLTFSAWGETVLSGMPKYIESGITIDTDEFYGDIVEFDNYLYKTTKIADVCHRFNTAQREFFGEMFKNLFQDVIVSDDYDYANVEQVGPDGVPRKQEFTVEQYYLNDVYSSMNSSTATTGLNLMYANISPEGYFYNPNNKVVIKQEGSVQHSNAVYLNYGKCSVNGRHVVYIYKRTPEGDVLIGKKYPEVDYGSESGNNGGGNNRGSSNDIGNEANPEAVFEVDNIEGLFINIEVPVDYGFIKGDYICFYDKETKSTIWGEITAFKDMTLTINFNEDDFGGLDILAHKNYFDPNNLKRRYFAFWSENNVPLYAKLCMETNEFSWRNLTKQSSLDKNSELFDTPFSNGRLYIERNINFFLKRQDPRGDYGLSMPVFKHIEQVVPNPMIKFLLNGTNGVNLSKYHSLINNVLNSCY